MVCKKYLKFLVREPYLPGLRVGALLCGFYDMTFQQPVHFRNIVPDRSYFTHTLRYYLYIPGPHREMAVDVPDSFIARNKTPPRYPPPRPPQVRQRSPRDEEPLLSSSGGSSTSFGSKQSTLLRSAAIHLSGPVSDTSGSYKTQDTNTLELMSEPQSSEGSRTSFGSKKSSKGSSETAKCGDLFSDRSASAASNSTHTLNDHIIQLLISNGDESLLECKEGVSYSAKTDSVLIREAIYASYNLPSGFDTTPVLLGREVAVDVPDTFVQIVKTTPKYPCTVNRKSVAFHQVTGTFMLFLRRCCLGLTNEVKFISQSNLIWYLPCLKKI